MSRLVVVTGGTRGIGAAISRRFTDAGDKVVALNSTDLDVTREDAVSDVLGPLEVDVLVNNAGISTSAPVHRTTLDDWRAQFEVNATGAFLCTRTVLPGMRERDRGRIVTVASTAALAGRPYTAGYTASKHAAVGLMRAVAAEVAGTGVTANAVCPTFVRTDMTDRHGGQDRLARPGSPTRTARRRSPRCRRWAGCSSPTRSRSRWRSSPRPRRARSTARRSSSTEEESRHESRSGRRPVSPTSGSTSTSRSPTGSRR